MLLTWESFKGFEMTFRVANKCAHFSSLRWYGKGKKKSLFTEPHRCCSWEVTNEQRIQHLPKGKAYFYHVNGSGTSENDKWYLVESIICCAMFFFYYYLYWMLYKNWKQNWIGAENGDINHNRHATEAYCQLECSSRMPKCIVSAIK